MHAVSDTAFINHRLLELSGLSLCTLALAVNRWAVYTVDVMVTVVCLTTCVVEFTATVYTDGVITGGGFGPTASMSCQRVFHAALAWRIGFNSVFTGKYAATITAYR